MLRLYSPVFILQMFCLYHAYTEKSEQKWYWIILFFPLVGSLLYLYDTFYTRRNVDNLAETLKSSFVSNYKIDKLEKQLSFSDTVSNKVELAAEHQRVGNFERAIELLRSCLVGVHDNDPDIISQLVQNAYLDRNYLLAVKYGAMLKGEKTFENSKEKLALAWSYHKLDRNTDAEKCFEEMNKQFMNYEERHDFALFYSELGRTEQAMALLHELLDEIDSMDAQEKRQNKIIHRAISRTYSDLSNRT